MSRSIPRGFGLQRKEQILPWQHTLLPSDVATALIEELRGHIPPKDASWLTSRASSELGSIPALPLSSYGTWASHLGLVALKRGLIE